MLYSVDETVRRESGCLMPHLASAITGRPTTADGPQHPPNARCEPIKKSARERSRLQAAIRQKSGTTLLEVEEHVLACPAPRTMVSFTRSAKGRSLIGFKWNYLKHVPTILG